MVDGWTGKWFPEEDYSIYPKEKWCDYDYMAVWIMEQGYEVKTDYNWLISMIFDSYENEIGWYASYYSPENFDGTEIEAAQAFVMDSGGLKEFDYYV